MKKILRFKKYEEPYIYKRGDTSVSCTRYIIESMSPTLNSLYQKVKGRARVAGINKIINIDKANVSKAMKVHEGQPALLDRKDGNNNIVIGFMPEIINEWIYAHELIHYLNPEVEKVLQPTLSVSHTEINIEILNEIARGLFGVIVDHFINRLVLQAEIDIAIFIEFHTKVGELHPGNPLQRTYFVKNLLATLLMEKFIGVKDRHYQQFIGAKRTIENKYPQLIPLLLKFIDVINSIGNFEFKDIQTLYEAVLFQEEIINGLYQFAVNTESPRIIVK